MQQFRLARRIFDEIYGEKRRQGRPKLQWKDIRIKCRKDNIKKWIWGMIDLEFHSAWDIL